MTRSILTFILISLMYAYPHAQDLAMTFVDEPIQSMETSLSLHNTLVTEVISTDPSHYDFAFTQKRQKLFSDLQEAYDKADWKLTLNASIQYLEESPWRVPERPLVYYYAAKAFVNQGDFSEAIRNFDLFIPQANVSMKETAELEKAICKLQINKSEALTELMIISQTEMHSLKDEARSIIGVFQN